MDKFSELKAAAMAATPGPWGIDRTGNTIVSNQSHPLATVSDAFHRQLAGGGVGKDAEFIAAANPAVVLALLAELEAKDKRIVELELRLAVEIDPPPVIYPGRYDCHAMHSAIRRAGFRVLGDSEHVGDVDMRDERALAAVSDKQRIAELEAIRSDASQVFKEIATELGCNPDNESIMMAIDDLKATQMTGPLKEVLKRNIELEAKTAMTMGVGSGNGNLFVHGDYDSIKAAQAIVLENESLRAKLATPVRLQSPWVDKVGNRWLLEGTTADVIRTAGFAVTVEGDE
ncbi:ead/Ea22-like family protein [Serratia marcescens]|uniref:ead/Ea22-like family protein n=1 Tax=Serratia marcescens TaxID=615 RepID=UPI003D9AB590